MIKFIKFLGAGGIATVMQYTILIILVEIAIATPVVASTIGYIASSLCNYWLNYYITFSSSAKHHLAAIRFTVVVIVGLSLNSVIIYCLNEKLSVYYVIAQVVSTIVVLFWNFFAHKHWTYRSAGS